MHMRVERLKNENFSIIHYTKKKNFRQYILLCVTRGKKSHMLCVVSCARDISHEILKINNTRGQGARRKMNLSNKTKNKIRQKNSN